MLTSAQLQQTLESLPNFKTFLIGFSGGMDSSVLLHAVCQIRQSLDANIEAVHVHHGLQDEANDWAIHCRNVCQDWHVPLQQIRIDAAAKPGESPEAAARAARYAAISRLLDNNTCLLTAHHQQDQAETFLLQLVRGAGPAGLASMPLLRRLGEGWQARPMLEASRHEILEYATQHGLVWVDDPSNQEIDADRNFLRHRLMPLLGSRWPAADKTIARSARHQAEMSALLTELAAVDAVGVRGSRSGTLSVSALLKLKESRRNNLLRYWIKNRGLAVPSQRQISRILPDVLLARWDSCPCIHWEGAEVRRYRDEIYAMRPLPEHDANKAYDWTVDTPLEIPSIGLVLDINQLREMGLQLETNTQTLQVRFRSGGEICKPINRNHHHELRKLFQKAGVPPWERSRIPLIYSQEKLLAVLGYWVCS